MDRVFTYWFCVLMLLCTLGCTHWSTTRIFANREEVSRRLLGSPQVAESSSSRLSGEVSGSHHRERERGSAVGSFVGGLFGQHSSIKRTHCIQKARIAYVQLHRDIPFVRGRPADLAGSIGMMMLGGIGILVGAVVPQMGEGPAAQSSSASTALYISGGVVAIGGLSWLILSYALLPAGKKPAIEEGERRWQETKFVESRGCGLVPKDRSKSTRQAK
ncbi:MAG: hypothetical protein AAGJ35_16130, partial [Myxococcota bacterium]